MNYRLSFLLVGLAGCGSVTVNTNSDDSGDDSASSQGSTATTGPTGEADASESQADTGTSGGQEESQSGTGTTQGSEDTGLTSTGDSTGTSSTGDSSSTGGCLGATGPAPVLLGSDDDLAAPGAYVILAKTAITNVPGSKIAGGNIGLSPAAASAITGFALTLEPAGVYSTSPDLAAPFKIYAADYVVPTPVNLTTAVLGMQAAYSDAAGRVPADYLDLESGNIGGLTLSPGLYTWGSTVLVPEDVTLEGCPDDVWIFQISGDLDVSTGKQVILGGGARASNVFWQVAGAATIHTDAHFAGVILAKTSITLQTEASMDGRAMAQTMVALDRNAVTAP